MLKCLQQVLRVLSPANCVQCHSPKQMPATKRKVAIPQLHVLLPVKNFSLSLVSIHLQIYCLPHGATMCLLKIPNFAPLMSFGSTQAVRSSQVMPWHLGEDLFRNSWHLLGDIATVMVERMGDLWIYCMENYGPLKRHKRYQEITCNHKDWIWLGAWIAAATMSFSVSIVQEDWCSGWRLKDKVFEHALRPATLGRTTKAFWRTTPLWPKQRKRWAQRQNVTCQMHQVRLPC